jgi:nitroreductase
MSTQLEHQSNILEAIHLRRAVRAYTNEELSEASVRELLDAAVQAPTAMHLEPWGFVVIQDKALLKHYSDRAKSTLLEQAEGGTSLRRGYRAMLSDPAYNIFHDAGTLIVICRRTSRPFAEADCWLAAENLMLAATAKGLATCCIGFAVHLLNAPDVKRDLRIPDEGAAVAPVIVGFASGPTAPVSRKPPEILRWVK